MNETTRALGSWRSCGGLRLTVRQVARTTLSPMAKRYQSSGLSTSRIVRRKALKPKPQPTDAQLLASATRAAKKAAKEAERRMQAERIDRDNRRAQP